MTPREPEDLSHLSMMDLFRLETETQTALLEDGLLALERAPEAVHRFKALMRAAHSLKGAARLVNLEPGVKVAHALEDYFVAAQAANVPLAPERVDVLLSGVDLLRQLAAQATDAGTASEALNESIQNFVDAVATSSTVQAVATPVVVEPAQPPRLDQGAPDAPLEIEDVPPPSVMDVPVPETSVRVSAENIDRLLQLASESIVAARWMEATSKELAILLRRQMSLSRSLRRLTESWDEHGQSDTLLSQLAEIQRGDATNLQILAERFAKLQNFDQRLGYLANDFYHTVLDCRMRPFADGTRGLARMVREIARSLGKEAHLEIWGEATLVDRDILAQLEAPLGHLLRNAIDHGIEFPAERAAQGKTAVATIRLNARHVAGQLQITVEDDGRGINVEALRYKVLERGMVTAEMAQRLSDQELTEFLFLPGFSLKTIVTEISGRGVGLDVVQSMVRDVGGTVSITAPQGQGMRFELRLPVTLSVVRALLVEIADELYAFPLARVLRVVKLPRSQIESVEGRQHFLLDGRQIGLVSAHQVLGLESPSGEDEVLSILVIGGGAHEYGMMVDGFVGDYELAVRPLDARLGKVPGIAAAALMPDQSPVLIIDVDDFIHSIRRLTSEARLAQISLHSAVQPQWRRKRVLVVDDSLTVRELERKLIASRGYEVEVAVDGMDAWNLLRANRFDLVVTDVDMPRLDGIELTMRIKNDAQLREMMVMIVSYKDREADRLRGLEAGADYYLAKSSFHDDTLLTAVGDLIGEVEA